MSPQTVKQISEWFIKPQYLLEEAKNPIYLGPWELPMLSLQYSQKGLLFEKSTSQNTSNIDSLVQNLKESLSVTLVHFYPLAGRFATLKPGADPSTYSVFIDCSNTPGARLVHASVNATISDILSPNEVPEVVYSLFDHNGVINSDGHSLSLLTLQVTELLDGVFIGGSVNHCVADGTSWWHFMNTLSEVFKAKAAGQDISAFKISRPPVHTRWCPDGYGPIFSLPITADPYRLVSKSNQRMLKDRVFHFSTSMLAKIKARANAGNKTTRIISTLQALIALTWRSVTRIRSLADDQVTDCRMWVDSRARLIPPLSPDYFGNTIQTIGGKATAGEILANDFGWAAGLLNQAVAQHCDKAIRDNVDSWLKSPSLYQLGPNVNPTTIRVGSSPRFNMYPTEFGMGKAVAARSGGGNKFDGKVTLYPGVEGGGSIDLEMTLCPESMTALECDEEFMDVFNFTYQK